MNAKEQLYRLLGSVRRVLLWQQFKKQLQWIAAVWAGLVLIQQLLLSMAGIELPLWAVFIPGTLYSAAVIVFLIMKRPSLIHAAHEFDEQSGDDAALTALSFSSEEGPLQTIQLQRTVPAMETLLPLVKKKKRPSFLWKPVVFSLTAIAAIALLIAFPSGERIAADKAQQEKALVEEAKEELNELKKEQPEDKKEELEQLMTKIEEEPTIEKTLTEMNALKKKLEKQQMDLKKQQELDQKALQTAAGESPSSNALSEEQLKKLEEKLQSLSDEQKAKLEEQLGKTTDEAISSLRSPSDTQISSMIDGLSTSSQSLGSAVRNAGLLSPAEVAALTPSDSESGESEEAGEGQQSADGESGESGDSGESGESSDGGEGDGSGEGTGSSGEGNTSGEGSQGNGQGSGSGGNGNGSGSGQGSGGSNAGTGTGSRELLTIPSSVDSDEFVEQDSGQTGDGEQGERFESDGPVSRGTVRPYDEVYRDYENQARESLERSPVPAELQGLIENYFSTIEPDGE